MILAGKTLLKTASKWDSGKSDGMLPGRQTPVCGRVAEVKAGAFAESSPESEWRIGARQTQPAVLGRRGPLAPGDQDHDAEVWAQNEP